MPETRPPMGGVRRPKGWVRLFLPYWVAALALAYGIHVDLVPVRHWLAMAASPPEAPAEPSLEPAPATLPPSSPPAAPSPEPSRPMALASLDLEERHPASSDDDEAAASDEPADPDRRDRDADDPDDADDGETTASSATTSAEDEAPDEDLSHLWSVEDPVLTRHPEPERRRVASSTEDDSDEERREPPRAVRPERERRREKKIRRSGGSSGGRSCEAAIASYREQVKMGDDSAPADITAARYGAVLNRGSYFSHCGVPESTAIHICAAVQNGRAVGVTVTTTPRSGAIERCVAGAVRGLGFPSHPRMDVTRTTFE